jgi:hypothetical protein
MGGAIGVPVFASHTRAAPSSAVGELEEPLAVTIRLPSGLNVVLLSTPL